MMPTVGLTIMLRMKMIMDEEILNIDPNGAESIHTVDEAIFQDLMSDLASRSRF